MNHVVSLPLSLPLSLRLSQHAGMPHEQSSLPFPFTNNLLSPLPEKKEHDPGRVFSGPLFLLSSGPRTQYLPKNSVLSLTLPHEHQHCASRAIYFFSSCSALLECLLYCPPQSVTPPAAPVSFGGGLLVRLREKLVYESLSFLCMRPSATKFMRP